MHENAITSGIAQVLGINSAVIKQNNVINYRLSALRLNCITLSGKDPNTPPTRSCYCCDIRISPRQDQWSGSTSGQPYYNSVQEKALQILQQPC